MKNKVLFISIAVFFQATSISSALLIVDQAQDLVEQGPNVGYGINNNLWSWQEFKPAMNNLEQVDLYLEAFNIPVGRTVFFEIRNDQSTLWSTSFSANSIPSGTGWFEIDTPQVSLVPNQTYRLYLTSTLTDADWEQSNSDIIWWGIEGGDPYPIGTSSGYSTDFDFGFRTWAVPEPATLLLLTLGGLMLRRRRA